jgi:hypothetical protein
MPLGIYKNSIMEQRKEKELISGVRPGDCGEMDEFSPNIPSLCSSLSYKLLLQQEHCGIRPAPHCRILADALVDWGNSSRGDVLLHYDR